VQKVIIVFILIFLTWLKGSSQESYRSNNSIIINEIKFSGNKRTREPVLIREIPFNKGDTLDTSAFNNMLIQTKLNLLNTSLFNFVDINTFIHENGNADVIINMIERHYIWPLPFFEIADRNFNTWIQKKDLSRTYYGVYLVVDNFRGRRESLKFLIKGGLDQSLGISYQTPNINKDKTIGLGLGFSIASTGDIAYNTAYDKQQFINVPGTRIKLTTHATIQATYRPDINNYHTLTGNHSTIWLADTVMVLNPQFAPSNQQQFFSLSYSYRNDHRDFRPYPLKGHYFECRLEKKGLGILNNEDVDILTAETVFRKYSNISNRFYIAAGFYGRLSAGNKFLYNQKQILGFGNTFVRGYEYYTVNGLHTALARVNLKYEILPQKIIKLPIIKTEKFKTVPLAFYLNLYSDLAFVYDNNPNITNQMPNNELFGKGIGIDFVTYYDKILRVEYSFNGFNESGLFFHFISSL